MINLLKLTRFYFKEFYVSCPPYLTNDPRKILRIKNYSQSSGNDCIVIIFLK